MKSRILLLSGPIAVGKTTLRDWLVANRQFRTLSSSFYLREIAAARGLPSTRLNLQTLGDGLDKETDYRWVIDLVALPAIESNPSNGRWLFDSVRKRRQLEHFRATFGASVLHAHLTAPAETLRERFELRKLKDSNEQDAAGYDNAISHPNELEARSLAEVADVVVIVDGVVFEENLKDLLARYEEG